MVKFQKHLKTAFTMAEMIIALVAIGILVVMTLKVVLKQTPDKEKALFKKTYAQIETAVASLINDETIYPDNKGFANTTPIEDLSKGEKYGSTATIKKVVKCSNGLSDFDKYYNAINDVLLDCAATTAAPLSTSESNCTNQAMYIGRLETCVHELADTYPVDSADSIAIKQKAEFLDYTRILVKKVQGESATTLSEQGYTADDVSTLSMIKNDLMPLVKAFATTGIEVDEADDTKANAKFKEALMSKFDILEDNVSCKMYYNTSSFSSGSCFMTDSGAVIGVPATNFSSVSTIKYTNIDGDTIPYVPITIYTNWDKDKNTKGEDAIIVGVSKTGNIRLFKSVDCVERYADSKQCLAREFLKSDTIRNTRRKK